MKSARAIGVGFTAAAVGLTILSCGSSPNVGRPPDASNMAAQLPSPMTDSVRAHERVERAELPGRWISIDAGLPEPVPVYLPQPGGEAPTLLVHFHGPAWLAADAVSRMSGSWAAAAINLGSGSSAYERPFATPSPFRQLISAVEDSLRLTGPGSTQIAGLYVSSFSAGYGAIRALLRREADLPRIDGLMLLDGLHTDYVPDRTRLADGGALNTEKLEPFLRLSELALDGRTTLLITHSEIFPGTYASTTETANYLVRRLDLSRDAVLRWGPVGMQQLSEARSGRLVILGFAGNTAPDHVDHLHGLSAWLELVKSIEAAE